jgi:hypothetical protein
MSTAIDTKQEQKSVADDCIAAYRRNPKPHYEVRRDDATGLAVYAPRPIADEARDA